MKRPSRLHVVCSWCGEPVAQEGEQLRLFEAPDRTTHTICARCYETVTSAAAAR